MNWTLRHGVALPIKCFSLFNGSRTVDVTTVISITIQAGEAFQQWLKRAGRLRNPEILWDVINNKLFQPCNQRPWICLVFINPCWVQIEFILAVIYSALLLRLSQPISSPCQGVKQQNLEIHGEIRSWFPLSLFSAEINTFMQCHIYRWKLSKIIIPQGWFWKQYFEIHYRVV